MKEDFDVRELNVTQKQYTAMTTPANEVLFGGSAGSGKFSTLDGLVLTPFGFKQVKDLKVGDAVNNPDGSICKIIQLHPITEIESFRVSFSDGTSTVVSNGHLWKAWKSGKSRKIKNKRTNGEDAAEIVEVQTLKAWTEKANEQQAKGQRPNWALIPICKPQKFNVSIPYPSSLDPYLLGTLLGDGTITSNQIALTTIDYDHFQYEYDSLFLDYSVGHKTLRFVRETRKMLEKQLTKLKLLNTYSDTKFIPRQYKYSSVENRIAILQGLFDTDGTVSTMEQDGVRTGCNISYTTVSKQLAKDVQFIVQSLGGTATRTIKKDPFYRDEEGNKVFCKDAYVLYIKLPNSKKYFRMQRKIDLAASIPSPNMCRRVVSVESVGKKVGRCITVSHPNGLYLTNDFIVTHNSHLMRYASIVWCLTIPGLQVYLFRRKYADLEKNHLYGPTGYLSMLNNLIQEKKVKVNYSNLRIDFANGSQIYLCHCQHEKDKYNYQGAEIHVLMIDELTHFTKSIYTFLRSRVRMAGMNLNYEKIKKMFPYMDEGFFPRILCGTNPGGTGHSAFKQMFLDPVPAGEIWKTPPSEGGMNRQYIPALIYENPYLLESDPQYMERLKGMGDKYLVHAMLTGDWDIIAGGAIDDVWKAHIHVINSFEIPSDWRIDRSFDWGSAKPFSCCWWAESNGNPVTLADGTERTFPRGTLFLIGELYGWTGEVNVGSRKTAREQGAAIREYELGQSWGHRVRPGPADTAIFDKQYVTDTEESVHDQLVIGYNNAIMKEDANSTNEPNSSFFKWNAKPVDSLFTKADKSPGSRIKGLEMLRTYLKASLESPMENKGLFIFDKCRQFIRTVPVIPRDEKNPEDVDSESEDHIFDAVRYRIYSKTTEYGTMKLSGL